MTLSVVFMGTPDFAVPSLAELLANGFDVKRVYTQPPRRAGRGKQLTKSPVHEFAQSMGLQVETPESFRKPCVINALEDLSADVACVVAYGQILPQRALDAPHYGCLNLHGSLLPRWRGAAPIQRAIMAGDVQTGVQIMQMAKGLDTGDILLSETLSIQNDDTAARLSERMARIGANMWPRALAALERGSLTPAGQTGAPSYARKIDKAEARIDWNRPAKELGCHIRGLAPFPGAWCEMGGKRVKVHMAQAILTGMINRPDDFHAGDVLPAEDKLLVACGKDGAETIELATVQPAGKSAMSGLEFSLGYIGNAAARFS